jgi:nitrogen regulatory protein PII
VERWRFSTNQGDPLFIFSLHAPVTILNIERKNTLKLVIAVIQPTKLNAVREALEKLEVTRLTVCDAQGFGRQRGRTEMFRGHEYATALLRKVVLEIFVNDDFLDRTIETICNTARTGVEGTIGDGKIFVLPADKAIQINDGARGPGAV